MKRRLISTCPNFEFGSISARVGSVLLADCVEVPPLEAATKAALTISVVLDAAQRFQQMDGFGASSFGGFGTFGPGYFDQVVPKCVTYKTTPEQRTAILSTAIRGLRLTHVRPPEFSEPPASRVTPQEHDWSAFNWAGDSGKPASGNMSANRGNGLVEWGDFLRVAVPLGLKEWIVPPVAIPGTAECFPQIQGILVRNAG